MVLVADVSTERLNFMAQYLEEIINRPIKMKNRSIIEQQSRRVPQDIGSCL